MTKQIVKGNILETDEETTIIIHQTNCGSKSGYVLGLAKDVFEKYPESNTYYSTIKRIPGTISVHQSGKRTIINLYGQLYPGKPNNKADSAKQRRGYFKQALDEIAKRKDEIIGTKTLAFPFKIGCGLAKGNWNIYLKMIQKFEIQSGISVVIYDFEK